MDKSQQAVNIFNSKAMLYEDKYMDVGLYKETLDQFCDLVLVKNPTVFELACGPGNITKYLLEKRPDFKVKGIDLSPKMVERALHNNPKASFEVMDCRAIGGMQDTFNAIMCGFCLPYLTIDEALQLIEDTHGLLQRNGVLYVSTMEDDYGQSGYKESSSGGNEQMYIHYHQADYLTLKMKEVGYTKIQMYRISYASEEETTNDLILIAVK